MKLIDAIKAKFQKPEDALAALGLDAAAIAMDTEIKRDEKGRFSPEAHRKMAKEHREKISSSKLLLTQKNLSHQPYFHSLAERAHTLAAYHQENDHPDRTQSSKKAYAASKKANRHDPVFIKSKMNDSAITGDTKITASGKGYDAPPRVTLIENKEKPTMTTSTQKKWSPTALVAMGALQPYLTSRLATDSAIDLRPILRDVTAKNFAARRPFITTEIRRAVVGNLAQDADVEDLPEMLDQIGELADAASEAVGGGEAENPMADPPMEEEEKGGEDDANEIREFLADKLSPEDLDTVCGMIMAAGAHAHEEPPAETPPVDDEWEQGRDARAADAKARLGRDETPEECAKREAEDRKAYDARRAGKDEAPEMKPAMDKKAMDAAIEQRVSAAIRANDARHAEVATALRTVRPYTGELNIAFDSAEAVYRHTLTALGVAAGKTAHRDALPEILAAQPKPGARPNAEPRLAHDAAAAKGFGERFPSAGRIGTA